MCWIAVHFIHLQVFFFNRFIAVARTELSGLQHNCRWDVHCEKADVLNVKSIFKGKMAQKKIEIYDLGTLFLNS